MHQSYDICIIGAGPAGTTLAVRLAQLGHRVCLIERSRFPRRCLGESLTPGVLPLLETLGAREAVEAAGFTRVHGVNVSWDQGPQERHDPSGQGLLVDRGRFDRMLLDNAIGSGANVLQPATVQSRQRHNGGWQLRVLSRGRTLSVQTRFLADAGGRSGAFPGRRRRTGCRTLALYAYWRGRQLPKQPRIEAGVNAWYWGVPLPDGTYNTLVFVDPVQLKTIRSVPLVQHFKRLLEDSSLMDGCREPRLLGGVRAANATPHLDQDCVTLTSIRVGDSALSLDPLSSSGVQKAIQNALSSAIVVNTLLRRPASSSVAQQFYRDRLTETSERHGRWAASYYQTVAVQRAAKFWQDRARNAPAPPTLMGSPEHPNEATVTQSPLALSGETQIVDLPVLDRDFVEVRPAVRHPGLDGPVAYIGGLELAPLLHQVKAGMIPSEIARSWSSRIPPKRGMAICRWLVHRGVLVSQNSEAPSPALRSGDGGSAR